MMIERYMSETNVIAMRCGASQTLNFIVIDSIFSYYNPNMF